MKYLLGDSIEEMEAHRSLLQWSDDVEARWWTAVEKQMTKTEEVFIKINNGEDFRKEKPATLKYENGIVVEINTFHFLNEWYEYSEDGNKALTVLKRWQRMKDGKEREPMDIAKMFAIFFAGYTDMLDYADSDATLTYDGNWIQAHGRKLNLPKDFDGRLGFNLGDTRTEGSNSFLQHVLQFVHFELNHTEYVVVKIGNADLVVLESNGRTDDGIFEFNHAHVGCMDCDSHWWTTDGGQEWEQDGRHTKNLEKYEPRPLTFFGDNVYREGTKYAKNKLCYLAQATPRSELADLGILLSDGDIDQLDGEVLPEGTVFCPHCSGILKVNL